MRKKMLQDSKLLCYTCKEQGEPLLSTSGGPQSTLLSPCYGLNFVSPKICWDPDSQGDGIRRWGLWGVMRSWGWNSLVVCCCLVARLCPVFFDPMDCSMLGFPPSFSPRVCSNSCPLSGWCHPTISSSATHFSSCPQSFTASWSFPMSWFFPSGGQTIGTSASALSMSIHGWVPLGLTGLISLLFKGFSKAFSSIISVYTLRWQTQNLNQASFSIAACIPGKGSYGNTYLGFPVPNPRVFLVGHAKYYRRLELILKLSIRKTFYI